MAQSQQKDRSTATFNYGTYHSLDSVSTFGGRGFFYLAFFHAVFNILCEKLK